MSRRLGAQAESEAAEFLQRAGYRILERNYRCRQGEIDLIAEQDGVLCFVEVKSRASERYGPAASAVGPLKQRRLARTAAHYLQTRRPGERLACRFDVVTLDAGVAPVVIPDAFRLERTWGL
jgi:putative endonuclease